MKFLLLIVFVLLANTSFSQDFINFKKSSVRKKVSAFYTERKLRFVVTETDTTISFLVRDTASFPLTLIYVFNQHGRCYKEIKTGNCEQCFQKLFTDAVSMKRYHYKKINDRQFISKPFWGLTVIVHESETYSYSIVKNYYSHRQQKKLYKSSL